jgi:D-arabinose 1-dehydrogenase-like Zn-dependent alcohol dehydrogenase
MREVLKNQRLLGRFLKKITAANSLLSLTHAILGSTMGSHRDLIDATNFLSKYRIVPVVSHVLDGLEKAEEGFEILKHSDQFGKVVIRVRHDHMKAQSKL